MKKGYILTAVLILVMAVGWGIYNYAQKTAPAPAGEANKASDSANKSNNTDQIKTPPAISAQDKEPASNLSPETAQKETAGPDTKIEKQSASVANTKSKPQTPANAAEAIEQAKANGESMWLLFRSQSCAPCVEMKKVFDRLQPEYQGKVRFIAIDVDAEENQELAMAWGIQYIPATFILNRKGEINYENIGFFPEEDLKKELDRVVK